MGSPFEYFDCNVRSVTAFDEGDLGPPYTVAVWVVDSLRANCWVIAHSAPLPAVGSRGAGGGVRAH